MAELGSFIAEKLIGVLGRAAITKVCEAWGYQTELEALKQTVSTVRMVLLDADAKWDQLSNQDRDFIMKLKDVVYDADDVFDELLTLAELNQLDGRLKKRDKIFEKVCRFFSSKNHMNEAYRMSCEVKDIKQRLDVIANNRAKFNLGVDLKPISRRPKETCSYVDENVIIGRDKDKERIVDMLLDPNNPKNVSVLTIVGVGGLGKTTLAQLVLNDEKIKQEFPDQTSRLWVCVSNQDGEKFDDKIIMCEILNLVTKEKLDNNSSKELVQRQFQETIKGKKFLLVLDDIWNEDREKWLNLENFLRMVHGRSWIIVTTRSEETTTIIGSKHIYKLDGLSLENSQHLFEMSAFPNGHKLENHNELVEIGKKIVEKCYCIPLALKVIGRLLCGQDIKEWQSIKENELAKNGKVDKEILSILKLSYVNLEPSLRSCFTYCALFPKDFRLEKEKIIAFWLAQGYIVPLDEDQNLEDAAEEHFIILLRRCFFEVVRTNLYGDVEYVKIHDLMHDVAQKVGEEEICTVTSKTYNMRDKIRHVYIDDGSLEHFMGNKKIRSYIVHFKYFVDAQIDNWMHLRVLILSRCKLKSLPYSIGKLLHLRYLDLSRNDSLEVLYESITKLYNLQTLDLSSCRVLRELPKGTSKLVNLRYLNVEHCYRLTSMPCGLDKLSNLRVLPMLVVGYKSITNKKQSCNVGMLKDLKAMSKIQGRMCVKIGKNYSKIEDINYNRGGYLKSMKYLRELEIEFELGFEDEGIEALLEKLEPLPNLKNLVLKRYEGKRIERWGRTEDNWAISLPLLVNIEISCCTKLEHLPVLSKLPHLKSLTLNKLCSLEYMENGMCYKKEASTTQLYPSLECLYIDSLPKLKGWWEVEGFNLYIFPCISSLTVINCPNLASNLICPRLESLQLGFNSERLQIMYGNLKDNVRTLTIYQGNLVKSIPIHCMAELNEKENKRGNLIEEVEEAFQNSTSSLHTLKLFLWEEEEEGDDEEDDEDDDGDGDYESWKSFNSSLRNLELNTLKGMKSIPKGIQHLTSLKSLYINGCKTIKELPEWLRCLSSLRSLKICMCPGIKKLPDSFNHLTSLEYLMICGCPDLIERCYYPIGEDVPKIQHVPKVEIQDSEDIDNDDE